MEETNLEIMTQQELKNGEKFHFDNETWCEENLSDDFRAGHVEFSDRFGERFHVWFNGVIIDSFKTFKATEKRLDKLFTKWNLEFTTEEV